MSSFCFVCDEMQPVRPGGAGSLIRDLSQRLLAQGHVVLLLLDLSRDAFERFDHIERPTWPSAENCRAYQVDALCATIDCRESDFLSRYTWQSYRYDYACRQVYELEKPDWIEFVDYCGPAYYALMAKICHLSYQDAHVAVRMHGPIELIDRSARTKAIDFDRYTIYALERCSLKLAETVLYPTPSLLSEYYPLDQDPWFGNAALAQPFVDIHPRRESEDPGASIVLFLGRLYAVKGVDLFVDAAVSFLSENPSSKLEFYLVGVDSMEPPVEGPGSYQAYLLGKVPKELHSHFSFTGFLEAQRLQALLPGVKFAVFPSFFETFCLAAHELHLAGIPLIVSDIPAFRDSFQGDEVLFFDGGLGDLVRQMKHLDTDHALRAKLSQVTDRAAIGNLECYNIIPQSSWITTVVPPARPGLLVCIIDDSSAETGLSKTLASVTAAIDSLRCDAPGAGDESSASDMRIVLLKNRVQQDNAQSATWLLGGMYTCCDQDGNPIPSHHARTLDTLLILRAGDELDPDFVAHGLDILSRQERVSFVCSWKWVCNGTRQWLYTHPFAQMLELAPFEALSLLNRCIMRTPVGQRLEDLFGQHNDRLAEIAHLWALDTAENFGVQIPLPLVRQQAEIPLCFMDSSLSYLILRDRSLQRSVQLNRYLVMLAHAYPLSRLPLQDIWARKSGLPTSHFLPEKSSFVVQPDWRTRLARRLSRGGWISQRLLLALRWLSNRLRNDG